MARKAGAVEVVIGLAFLFGMLWGAFSLGTARKLTCERDTEVARCTVDLDELLFSNTTVYSDVRNVRVTETKRKGGIRYGVAIKVATGREDEVLSSIPEEDARQAESWFTLGKSRVVVAKESHRTASTVMIVLFFLGLALIAFLVWRRIKRPPPDPGLVFCNIRPPDQR